MFLKCFIDCLFYFCSTCADCLRPIIGQPGNSSIISRVKLGLTTIQLGKRAGFDDVGHCLGLTAGYGAKSYGNGSGETTVVVVG